MPNSASGSGAAYSQKSAFAIASRRNPQTSNYALNSKAAELGTSPKPGENKKRFTNINQRHTEKLKGNQTY